MELEPISDSSQWDWGFHTVGAVSTRESSVFFPHLSNFDIYGMTPGPGMGPYRLREELAL